MKVTSSDQNSLLPWKICDSLTVQEAVLLMCGIVPEGGNANLLVDHAKHMWPSGVLPLVNFIKGALKAKKVTGSIVPEQEYSGDFAYLAEGSVDIGQSTVDVDSLRKLMRQRGIVDQFFNDTETPQAEYLDKENPSYAPKLAAAVKAWEAVNHEEEYQKMGTPKQNLEKWLRKHAQEYGLMHENGKFIEYAIEEISKIANWKPEGGAAKTPVKKQKSASKPVADEKIHIPKVNLPTLSKTVADKAPFDDEVPF